jgi:ribosomal protein L37AE/L43A
MAKQPELNLVEFIEKYGTEEQCIAHLFDHKWPNGYICEKCGATEYYDVKIRGLYECKHCNYQASVTANTIIHKSHTPLNKWFLAIFLASKDKRGLSALTLKKDIGVSYPTAWLILHKIREAMQQIEGDYQLCNIVEMDDTFVGASDVNKEEAQAKPKF